MENSLENYSLWKLFEICISKIENSNELELVSLEDLFLLYNAIAEEIEFREEKEANK